METGIVYMRYCGNAQRMCKDIERISMHFKTNQVRIAMHTATNARTPILKPSIRGAHALKYQLWNHKREGYIGIQKSAQMISYIIRLQQVLRYPNYG